MSLKEDYKDDAFDGLRKYQMIQNDDRTVSFVDVTEYSQEGDLFGADDINATNKTVNKAVNTRTITLAAANWSTTYPYTQMVSVSGITADDNIKLIGISIPSNATADTIKALLKEAGYLVSNDDATGSNTVTFKAYIRPTLDFTIIIEGA